MKSDDDAIADLYSAPGRSVQPTRSTRYTDFNGDGYADLAFWEQTASAEEQKMRVVFGGQSGNITEDLEQADFTVVAPEPVAAWPELGAGSLMVDVNGDGFADLVAEADGYDSGTDGAGYGHAVIVFGSMSPPAEQGLFDGTAVISEDSGQYLGDWDIGGGFGGPYPLVWSLGDIDFDGYTELNS